jgi:hypothetical protein
MEIRKSSMIDAFSERPAHCAAGVLAAALRTWEVSPVTAFSGIAGQSMLPFEVADPPGGEDATVDQHIAYSVERIAQMESRILCQQWSGQHPQSFS